MKRKPRRGPRCKHCLSFDVVVSTIRHETLHYDELTQQVAYRRSGRELLHICRGCGQTWRTFTESGKGE